MKKILSISIMIVMLITLLVPAVIAQTATASATPTRFMDFNPMSVGDVTQGFVNIGGNTSLIMINDKLEVVPGGAGTGIYYGPASEYGGAGKYRSFC